MTHTVVHDGKSYDVATSTHVDDHPSDESWLKRHASEISAVTGIASFLISAANFRITHKPRR